jgi:hypothetical protein
MGYSTGYKAKYDKRDNFLFVVIEMPPVRQNCDHAIAKQCHSERKETNARHEHQDLQWLQNPEGRCEPAENVGRGAR